MRVSISITLWTIVCALFGLLFAFWIGYPILHILALLPHVSKMRRVLRQQQDLVPLAFLAVALAQLVVTGISSSRLWRRARALLDSEEKNPRTGAYRETPPDMPHETDASATSEATKLRVLARNQLRLSALVSMTFLTIAVVLTGLSLLAGIQRMD